MVILFSAVRRINLMRADILTKLTIVGPVSRYQTPSSSSSQDDISELSVSDGRGLESNGGAGKWPSATSDGSTILRQSPPILPQGSPTVFQRGGAVEGPWLLSHD